jgi:transposase
VVGLSRPTIHRIWKAHGLQPHRVRTFKLSRDPHFIETLHDVVGLYLDPPERAVVFSVDAKTQIQALDRTQPGLPLKKDRTGTMTHEYKRHGTTTLFAATNVASGEIVAECAPQQRHQEFLRFARKLVRQVEPGLEIHFIRDNSSVHKTEEVKAWLARNPRVHFHFTPTSSSWLNLVERFFGALTQHQIRRLAVTSVDELITAIEAYVEHRNSTPSPLSGLLPFSRSSTKSRKLDGLKTLHEGSTHECGHGPRAAAGPWSLGKVAELGQSDPLSSLGVTT